MVRAAGRLAALASRRYVGALRIARLYAHGGDHTRAHQWLVAAFEQREPGIVHMGASWDWVELRGEPVFQGLLQRLMAAR